MSEILAHRLSFYNRVVFFSLHVFCGSGQQSFGFIFHEHFGSTHLPCALFQITSLRWPIRSASSSGSTARSWRRWGERESDKSERAMTPRTLANKEGKRTVPGNRQLAFPENTHTLILYNNHHCSCIRTCPWWPLESVDLRSTKESNALRFSDDELKTECSRGFWVNVQLQRRRFHPVWWWWGNSWREHWWSGHWMKWTWPLWTPLFLVHTLILFQIFCF